MTFHRKWCALLVALSLGLGALVTVPARSAASCPAMQLFAVRGSGQKAWDQNGYGEPLWTVYRDLKMKVPSMHSTPIDYPAIGFPDFLNPKKYESSVNTGDVELLSLIAKLTKSRCGQQTYIYLAGYSQGAQVVDDVLEMLSRSPSITKRIKGAVLFGDPRFNPKQSGGVDEGSFSPSLSGITLKQFHKPDGTFGTLAKYTSSEAPLIKSYCAGGDPICNWNAKNARGCFRTGTLLAGAPLIDCPHLNYDNLRFGTPKQYYVNAATEFLFRRSEEATRHFCTPTFVLVLSLSANRATSCGLARGLETYTGTHDAMDGPFFYGGYQWIGHITSRAHNHTSMVYVSPGPPELKVWMVVDGEVD